MVTEFITNPRNVIIWVGSKTDFSGWGKKPSLSKTHTILNIVFAFLKSISLEIWVIYLANIKMALAAKQAVYRF